MFLAGIPVHPIRSMRTHPHGRDRDIALLCATSRGEHIWGPLLEGIVGIAAGLIAFFWPGITALALLFVIAFWAIFTGVLEVYAAIRMRQVMKNEWALVLSGVVSVIFGILLVAQPGAGALAVVWLIGIYAVIFGIAMLAFAWRLRETVSARAGGARGSAGQAYLAFCRVNANTET